MRSGQLVRRRERDVGAEQRLDAHRRRHARGPGEAIRIARQQCSERAHELGPVEERQALLRLERQRFQARLAQRHQRRHDLAADLAPVRGRSSAARDARVAPGRRRPRRCPARARRGGCPGAGTRRSGRPAPAGTRSGRAPSVLARSRSIARTTSRGNGRPTPAAWHISRFSCSARRPARSTVARRRSPSSRRRRPRRRRPAAR